MYILPFPKMTTKFCGGHLRASPPQLFGCGGDRPNESASMIVASIAMHWLQNRIILQGNWTGMIVYATTGHGSTCNCCLPHSLY